MPIRYVLPFALVVALSAGCSRSDEADADASEASATAQGDAPARQDRSDRQEPKANAQPEATVATATQDATASAPPPEAPLRFDMTQGGEKQTAEEFEAWMDKQGVRVAEGADAGQAPVPAPADAQATRGGAPVESTAVSTRR